LEESTATSKQQQQTEMEQLDMDVQVYLAVMNRLVSHLGIVLYKDNLEEEKDEVEEENDKGDKEASSTTTTTTSQQDDDDNNDDKDQAANDIEDDDFVLASSNNTSFTSLSPKKPKHWHVEFIRGLAYPPHLLSSSSSSSSSSFPTPVVEWTFRQGISAPGHVCIRLQGYPTRCLVANHDLSQQQQQQQPRKRRKKRVPITCVFDASFRDEEIV
jgi:hypothetical protein